MGNNSTRKYIKQDLDRSIGNLEWAQDKLKKTAELLAEGHENLALEAMIVSEAIEYIKKCVNDLNAKI